MLIFRKVLICAFLLLASSPVYAVTGWVDDNGTATWSNCQGASPLSGASACSLSTANSNVAAGDIVNLRAGQYNVSSNQIAPGASGTSDNKITYQAYNGETVEFISTGSNNPAIALTGDDYIVIDGITTTDLGMWIRIRNGSDYNEIKNSTFIGSREYDHCIRLDDGGGGTASTHNWLHDNEFGNCGYINVSCNDQLSLFKIGDLSPYTNAVSNYNTIESNEFYGGGHDLTEINTKYNVVIDNHYHNEGWITDPETCTWGPSPRNGKYGNRNLQLWDSRSNTGMYNLIEGNRFGHASFASDGAMDGNLTIASPRNIIRYNDSFYSETWGVYFKSGAGSLGEDNRVYNNSIYSAGQDSQLYPNSWTGYGDQDWRIGAGESCSGDSCHDNVVKNNIIYNSYTAATSDTVNTYTNNLTTDPSFTDTDVSDPTNLTLPNLSLQSGSTAINNGTYLTEANGSGSSSTSLIVDDAMYFQDGSWGSSLAGHQADWIAIGTVSNVVEISSINYSTNTITLASAMTWSDNDDIWLYKDSGGSVVLVGDAPDQGSHEYIATATTTSTGVSLSGAALH